MNTVTITGNLTREPEIRYTRAGQATAQLGIAVNRRWQDRTTQEWQESTSFFDVLCCRDLAENVALSLTKGMRVVVTGRLEQRSWETDEGEHRSKVEIAADEIGPSSALCHRRCPPDRAAFSGGRDPSGRDLLSRTRGWGSDPPAPSPRYRRHASHLTRRHSCDGVIGRLARRDWTGRRSASSGRSGAPPRWPPAPSSPHRLGHRASLPRSGPPAA
jgi:single-strand DNA-binding protein